MVCWDISKFPLVVRSMDIFTLSDAMFTTTFTRTTTAITTTVMAVAMEPYLNFLLLNAFLFFTAFSVVSSAETAVFFVFSAFFFSLAIYFIPFIRCKHQFGQPSGINSSGAFPVP